MHSELIQSVVPQNI